MPLSIFISYRRDDTGGHAGRLFDHLKERFGPERVFLDVVGIDAGVNFVERLENAVASCDVLIAVIGDEWLNCRDAQGRRRLDDPNDFIRAEISAALRRNVRVVPVLVQGAKMPSTGDLPEDLKELTRRQAVEVRDSRWHDDVEDLVKRLVPASPASRGTWKRSWKHLLVPVACVAALVIAVWIGRSQIWNGLPVFGLSRVEVPQLAGKPRASAVELLESVGLTIGAETSRPDTEASPGVVLEQSPEVGASVERGTPVDLVLASTPLPLPATMPRLTGRPTQTAVELIEKSGLRLKESSRLDVANADGRGIVVSQSPTPDATVEAGGEVSIVLGFPVPSMVGLSMQDALTALDRARLKLGGRYGMRSKAEPDTIVKQGIPPGTPIEAGSEVDLFFAVAEPHVDDLVPVPSMVGLSMRDALDALKAAGLDLGSRRPRPSARPPGTILEQSIAAGTRVSRGSKVVLFYASVPPEPVAASVAVPSMVGMSMQDALTTLKKANLDLGSRRPKSSPRPPGTIVGQSIAPGTRVPPGSKVDLSYAAP